MTAASAITADVNGPLVNVRGGESPETTVAGPVDIHEGARVLEGPADVALDHARVGNTAIILAARSVQPRATFLDGLGLELLSWPDDLGTGRLSARAMQATLGDARFDAIVVRTPAAPAAIAAIWGHKTLHVLPVIDATGTVGPAADIDASRLKAQHEEELRRLVEGFRQRRALLSRDLLLTDDMRERLLARVFVSGSALVPRLDPTLPDLVAYNVPIGTRALLREAEALCAEGLLERRFSERLHECAHCHSRRLLVREECGHCRSSHVEDEQYIHHFRCAHQGAESDFRCGDALVCPKCRRELSHFGFDYDRPGTMVTCRHCGHASSECAVGFVCLDCSAHADANSCPSLDVHAYDLTAEGRAVARNGRSVLGPARGRLARADLPIELVAALNAAVRHWGETGRPFCLVAIGYDQGRAGAEHGEREFAKVRALFLENMRRALGEFGLVVEGHQRDFALLKEVGPQQVRPGLERLRERACRTLRFDPGARFETFGPEAFC